MGVSQRSWGLTQERPFAFIGSSVAVRNKDFQINPTMPCLLIIVPFVGVVVLNLDIVSGRIVLLSCYLLFFSVGIYRYFGQYRSVSIDIVRHHGAVAFDDRVIFSGGDNFMPMLSYFYL